MKAALALLLVILLLPSAVSQAPISACGPITIPAAPAAPAPVAAGGRTDVVVEVVNGGQLAATVVVAARTSSTGWSLLSEEATAQVAAGGRSQFTFTVVANDPAGDAQVDFAATGTCDAPVTVQCPGGACSAGNANSNVVVPLQPAEGFRLPGLDNIGPEVLIAAIILVGLASVVPFALRRKKGGIVADCPEPLKMVKPGRGTSFPIELRNPAKDQVVTQFEVGPVPEGWSAFMPLPEVQLAGREARSLWLMVRSPASAAQGDAVDIELRLKDPRGSDARVLKVRAEVQGTDA